MVSISQWDKLLYSYPQPHILQTTAWGQLKAQFGWQPQVVQAGQSGALILFRRLPLGFTLGYIPRGPLVDWQQPAALAALMPALDAACRAQRAICLKWEPDVPDTPAQQIQLTDLGLRRSPHLVQPARSIVVDLSGDEAAILAHMKQKTRYNIGLASKKGVTTRPAQSAADLAAFNQLMAITGNRENFGVHTAAYYAQAYALFQPLGQCELFLAEYAGQLLAGVMVFQLSGRAWYFYGASSNEERQRMAPYLAQWAGIRWAKAQGATQYDLWGVPDEPEATLEAEFEQRHTGLWGVYRFKRGFGGQVVRTVGAWDRVYQPLLYQLYLAYLRYRKPALG